MPEIRFTYQPPTAGTHEVGIAGDFTSWEIIELIDIGGIFLLSFYVENGNYRYKFIVDGTWLLDPNNPLQEPDPFGGGNSILVVRTDAAPRLAWEDVWQDLTVLHARSGHYLSLNRMSEKDYELRFNWYPSLTADLRAIIDGNEKPLFRLGSSGIKDVWHCLFSSDKPTVAISIEISAGKQKLFLGKNEDFTRTDIPLPLEITLSDLPVFAVPDWVHHGVIYQIFPDRFCKGDPSNDPDFSEDYYADSRTPPPDGEYLPPQREYFHLVRDWSDISGLKQSPYQEEGKPDWWSFYGGDIAGVRSKLDYLKELGITIIYINPLWQAKSNHKYDAADFKSIDPHFGTVDEMQALVKEAHQNGIRIIVDVAFNHTGESFWAFRDCVEKGPASPYWNWYDWKQWPLPKPLPADFNPRECYQCWWGIKDMPDLNFDLSRTHPSENYIRDISKAVPNQPLVDHILESLRWWLDEIGIDGFRLDVPDEVPYWFWQLFRVFVKKIRPDAWIVGEIWQSAQGWVGARYFDSVMNYAYFKNPVLEFFFLCLIDKHSFCARIEEGLAQYPLQAVRSMMNLLGSHDTHRILELAKGNTARLKLVLLFQMTFIGTPHIYYGDEIGMMGSRDPDNRRPFNWNWAQNPKSVELREFYKNLIQLRRSHRLLQNGEFAFIPAQEGILAYQRYDETGKICVALNYSPCDLIFNTLENGKTLYKLGAVQAVDNGFLLLPNSAVVIFYTRIQ